MFLRNLCYAALATVATAQLATVYQFPAPPSAPYINIENIVVRSSNGQLLLTTVTGPTLYQLNPGSQPEQIITLNGPDSMIGIAEVATDIYIVSAGNFSFGPQVPGGVAGIPGTFSVWSLDLTGPKAVAKEIVAIPEASSLNGVTAVSHNKDVVLIADSGLGAIWNVNTKTGAYYTAAQNALWERSAAVSFGINGIHVQGHELYWTNSAQQTYGKVFVSPWGGVFGQPQVIANATYGNFDDFALIPNGNGAAIIATQPNAISYVSASGEIQIIAGGGNDTTLQSPTSVVLKGGEAYITTGGLGAPPPAGQSGGVYSLNVSSFLGSAKRMIKKWIA